MMMFPEDEDDDKQIEEGHPQVVQQQKPPLRDSVTATEDDEILQRAKFFHFMAKHAWPFMIFWPVLFALLIGFGWTQDDIIEDEVNNIWIPQSGAFANDVKYAASLGEGDLASSAFAAMAIARDGGNLFTADRLEAIRQRMEETERTTISYKDTTFYWEDFCTNNGGFPYEFPCARLSPLDFFQEANWYMNFTGKDSYNTENESIPAENQDLYRRTWYKDLIGAKLLRPRIPRFGVLTSICPSQCQQLLGYRLFEQSPGYSPFSLFADIGNMEMNDDCRICIEEGYNQSINGLNAQVRPAFLALATGLDAYKQATGDTTVQPLIDKCAQLGNSITVNDIEEFYFYYVTRGVYGSLGAKAYMVNYAKLKEAILDCQAGAEAGLPLVCPASTHVTQTEAEDALRRHADAPFSSVTTPGSPFPFWSKGDGTGYLFAGDSPVGGSGIDMSANITSIGSFLGAVQAGVVPFDPYSDPWVQLVEKNPIYAWFMAGLTPAAVGTGCGNGFLTGTNLPEPTFADLNQNSTYLARAMTQQWCTKYNIPNTNNQANGTYTNQHFARMWYDLLIDSDDFLGIVQGEDDPYTWTTGQGCNYTLRGERYSYTGMLEDDILGNASRPLYFVDEGESVGVISPELLMGDVTPSISELSMGDKLEKVGVVQTLYAALLPKAIVQRVKHCKRPDGPLTITVEDAEELLYSWKEAMEHAWTRGWDDEDDGPVQFVGFFDDSGGVVGTTGRMLKEITLDNSTLTVIAIIFIAFFSAMFLFSRDAITSRVLVTLVGVALVVLAFFAAVGFAILIGVKISVTIAWTLPFIILGLGVDDMYIVLMAVRKQGGYKERHFLRAMKEVIVPVTMTSLVNASMFAILNVSDIPAVYITAQVAVYCVILLYCAIVFCYPAYVFLDLKRQAAGRRDMLFCFKKEGPQPDPKKKDFREIWLYDHFYKPLVLGNNKKVRMVSHIFIWLAAGALFGVGCYGLTQREIGLGLEDFFPSSNQAGTWATKRTETLASWSIEMNWGALDYTKPQTQQKMIQQLESVVTSPHVADVDTKRLWMADLLLWTTEHCTENFDREDFDVRECGKDKIFTDGSTCSATWTRNSEKSPLRNKIFENILDPNQVCEPREGGICRPIEQMHQKDLEALGFPPMFLNYSYCPTIVGWSDEKWQFCLVQWRNSTGFAGGRFILEEELGSPTDCSGAHNNDQNFAWPIPFSSGPTMFSFDLFTHQDTLDLLQETRKFCDEYEEVHCWLTGIPYEYWSQYEGIFDVLLELAGYATLTGFGIALIFLFGKLYSERVYGICKIFCGSLIGALLIAASIILSVVTVAGLSVLAGVSLTGFSNMSFVLSVGFAVEYSVHIVARWLRADLAHKTGLDRVKYTMSFLMLPTFMSFVSSLIGVVCLAFTEFDFNHTYFFKPLIIVMFTTYFYGCWLLPALLTLINLDVVKLGKQESVHTDMPLDDFKVPDQVEPAVPEAADVGATESSPDKQHGEDDAENSA